METVAIEHGDRVIRFLILKTCYVIDSGASEYVPHDSEMFLSIEKIEPLEMTLTIDQMVSTRHLRNNSIRL